MTDTVTRAQVHDVIQQMAGAGYVLDESDSLFEDGVGLDSMGFLELTLKLETVVGRRLRSELTASAIESIASFTDYVLESNS